MFVKHNISIHPTKIWNFPTKYEYIMIFLSVGSSKTETAETLA